MDTCKFKHFIITLFNLQLWPKDKHGSPTLTDGWLERRFELFERYCLPSVQNQTCKDFIWLCLFDADTPEPFKARIARYKERVPQFHACFFTAQEASEFRIPDDKKSCRFIRSAVASFLSADDDYVLTTNLDNDDALQRDMVGALQRNFAAAPRMAVYSLNYGVQYFTAWNALMDMRYPHNHFLSLAESAHDDFRTIEFYAHTQARKCLPVVDVFERAYWMEVVHDTNVNNDLRITSRIRYRARWRSTDLEEYGIPARIPWQTHWTNNLLRFPVYFFKTAYHRLRTKRQRKNK